MHPSDALPSPAREPGPVVLFAAVFGGAWAAQLLRPEAALVPPGPPWNWLCAVAPVVLGLLIALLRPDGSVARTLGSGRLAIAGLLAVALSSWPIAVFPVGAAAPSWLRQCGLGDPLSSLPFVVALLAVVLNLAVSLGRRMRRGPDRVRYAVVHAGLLIAIVGGTAGHGGLVRARFTMEEGAVPGDAVQADDGSRIHLPADLRLDDFVLETFPPMLVLQEGGRLTRGEALLGPGVVDRVRGLTITVRSWLPSAAVVAGGPVPFGDPGANPAAEVVVRDAAGIDLGSGWLHPASAVGAAVFLALPGGSTLHMEAPRPRRYLARVRADGRPCEITVNQPLRLGGWVIYLLSFDESLGPASRTAVFEAVEDRALPAVYLGLGLLLLGMLGHLWRPSTAGGRS